MAQKFVRDGKGDVKRSQSLIEQTEGPYVLRRRSSQRLLIRGPGYEGKVLAEIAPGDWKYPPFRECQANAHLFALSWDLRRVTIDTVEKILNTSSDQPVGFLLRDIYDGCAEVLFKLDMNVPELEPSTQLQALNTVAIPAAIPVGGGEPAVFLAWHAPRKEWIQVTEMQGVDEIDGQLAVYHKPTDTYFYTSHWAPKPPDPAEASATTENPE